VAEQTVVLGLAIVALNLVDAFATLRHVDHGAEELNPLMRALLRDGPSRFVAVKHVLASLGVVGIAMHPRLRAARFAMWLLLPLYGALASYQMALFWIIP
jgi:hypothetical protein